MSAEEANLQRDLRLMAYLDRQLPAEEARQLEADLAKDPALQAQLDELKAAFGGLDTLFEAAAAEADMATAPDWRASVKGAQQKFRDLQAGDATGAAGATANSAATARAAAKVIVLPRRSWFAKTLTAAAAVAAAAMFLIFVSQAMPYVALTPLAAPADTLKLPAALPVTVAPERAAAVKPAPKTLSREELIHLGLTPAQAEELLREGVLLVTHDELPGWQAAGLDPALAVHGQTLPTYLTADAVYNLFLTQMAGAAERFDAAQEQEWAALFGGCEKELAALRKDRGFDPQWAPAAERLQAICETGAALAGGQGGAPVAAFSAAAQGELKRLATAGDGVSSPLLLKPVNYAWIRQHPAGQVRRWLGAVSTAGLSADDAAAMTTALKLWWAVLQRQPALWAQYSQLALKIRAEEAGVAGGRDLIDLHAELTTLCGDEAALQFRRLMQGRLQSAAKPIGFLPPAVPFRNDLAQALGAEHSFIDAVLIHPAADASRFTGAQGRLKRLTAYRESQGAESAIARWNRLFDPVEQPAAAWPFTTAAWREKADRLLSAAWIGTPVRPRQLPAAIAGGTGALHYDRFEAAPDFYHRLQALCAERANTLAADDPRQATIRALAQWLGTLTQASLDQLAGRPQAGIDLPAAIFPAPAGAAGTQAETGCRVALVIDSADAGRTDLIMGNAPPAAVLLLQPDATGTVRVFVGAVSRPYEGLAAHAEAGPGAGWAQLTQDGTRAGFHYNGR